jgi:hypothetical protein
MIREGWEPESQPLVLPLTATVACFMVFGAKLVYGDWETAWNAGSFLVSLATLLWTLTNYAAR